MNYGLAGHSLCICWICPIPNSSTVALHWRLQSLGYSGYIASAAIQIGRHQKSCAADTNNGSLGAHQLLAMVVGGACLQASDLFIQRQNKTDNDQSYVRQPINFPLIGMELWLNAN